MPWSREGPGDVTRLSPFRTGALVLIHIATRDGSAQGSRAPQTPSDGWSKGWLHTIDGHRTDFLASSSISQPTLNKSWNPASRASSPADTQHELNPVFLTRKESDYAQSQRSARIWCVGPRGGVNKWWWLHVSLFEKLGFKDLFQWFSFA